MARKSRIVAVDTERASVWRPLLTQSLRGILRYAAQDPSWQLLFNKGPLEQRGRFKRFEDLPALGADGLITIGIQTVRSRQRIKALGIPVVAIPGRGSEGFPAVETDWRASGRMAARHLLDRGFRHFAFVSDLAILSMLMPYESFAGTVAAKGCSCAWFSLQYKVREDLIPNPRKAAKAGADEYGAGPGDKNFLQWLQDLPKPLGVMASGDSRAQQVLSACKILGLAVPGEVAVVGQANSELICESTQPPLSSVEPNGARIGFEAARLLGRLMAGEPAPDTPIWIPPRDVVARASSDALAVSDPHVRAAVGFIRQNLPNPIGLREIVRASGICCSGLERLFHIFLGRTVHAELLRQRIERAQQLMARTDLSLPHIAELSGFKSSYFSNVFAAKAGMSPGQWRREHR